MPWHQLSVTTSQALANAVSDCFADLGAVSVTFMDAQDEPIYEPALNEVTVWSKTQVIALYELDSNPQMIQQAVESQFTQGLQGWHIERVDDKAWELAWLEDYQPMTFGTRLRVCPSGMETHEAGVVCLTLDPGLAFGTGTHETTALCLEWLATHDLQGKTIIDYGCGSGILAIAATLLGADRAYAVDIDEQALTATQHNALKNKVADKIQRYLPENFPMPKTDILMANILAKPLIQLVSSFMALLIDEGILVLSGILSEQTEMVLLAYANHIDFYPTLQKGDWVCLVGKKKALP